MLKFTKPPCLHEPDLTKPFSDDWAICKKCGEKYKIKLTIHKGGGSGG